ncbi:MAG: hypothetical protein IJQ98_07280, partial [Oscillospiraceae bacterium]|nr:hypothetical protein [Oscillospiraceae bacterium]
VKLYEKAGGINENEQEQIVQAARGQAFAIMGPTSRSTFQIETAQGITDMFQERDYKSRYFSGEQGAINWEDFVAGSREAHDEALAESGRSPRLNGLLENEDFLDDGEDLDSLIDLSILDDDEDEDAGEVFSGGVRLNILDEDDENAGDGAVRVNILDEDETEGEREADDDNTLKGAASLRAPDEQGVAALAGLDSAAGGATVGQIASALGRIAEVLERGGTFSTPVLSPVQTDHAVAASAATSAVTEAPAAEGDARESAKLEERLREMEERLAHMQDIQEQKDEMIRILREQNDQLRSAPPESAEQEKPAAGEPVPEEEAEFSEPAIKFAFEDERTDEESDFFDEESDFFDEENDEENDEESGFFEEENDDEDSDFLSALSSYAAALEKMTVFERMRNDGDTVLRITLDDLTKAIKAKREKGSYF